MRDRSIDEFESIFEQASIPVLDIQEVPLKRVSAVVAGGALDDSVLALATYFKTRFAADVRLHAPAGLAADAIREQAQAREFEFAEQPFSSTAELVGQISIDRSQLVLLPRSNADDTSLDALIQGIAPPVLVVANPVEEPAKVFRNVLHSLTGNFRQERNFAYSFTLTENEGRILLLHAIDAQDIAAVRHALQLSPDIEEKGEAELLERLAHHGERYLKGVVAARHARPYTVNYRLAIGEVVPTVRAELEGGDYGLLVVGTHEEGHSHVAAADYQLLHVVRDIPVLAL